LSARQLGRDFRDHRLLLLQTKTQGLPPVYDLNGRFLAVHTTATWNQERRLRRAPAN